MNRLNKILLSFVLPILCLLISVSYADWTTTPIKNTSRIDSNYTTTPATFGDYTMATIKSLVKNYMNDSTTYETQYNSMVEYLENMDLALVFAKRGTDSYCFVFPDNIDVGLYDTAYYFINSGKVNFGCSAYSTYYYGNSTDATAVYMNINQVDSLFYSTKSVKKIVYANGYYWDGTYIYEVPTIPDEPDPPPLPSNAEIASAVQAFYNTIYNQSNIAFDDFIVLYDVSTGLYSYIGHTRGNAIGQVIVEPDGYYNGYKFDVQWWQFFLDEQNDSWEGQNITKYNNYYLYTSQGDIDTLKLVGQDKIDNLFTAGPWATSNTIIVYSTNDYPVKYITFSDESPDPVVETGTIRGDQYTYDENLDITDNQYNPLDNFVSVDYPSTLVSRAEFDKFMETFDENKDFLILPTDSNWIVIACNSLFNHFSSFIIMCAVFVIVERIMRG